MEEKKLLMRKMQKSFKLIVSSMLESKIRYLCSMFPTKEYSGTLFYTVEGTLEKGDIVITAKDFYLQDIGNATYTEFKNDATLVTYMIENDLLDCYTGIMHSHNTMSAFFSGTDINTLHDEGKDTNHFVSLIVNNRGEYKAAMTSKVTVDYVGKEKRTYHTFNDSSFIKSSNYNENETEIEYYDLDITVEGRPYTQSLNDRIKAINDIKASEAAKSVNLTGYNYYGYIPNTHADNAKETIYTGPMSNIFTPDIIKYPEKKETKETKETKEPKQLQLFEDEEYEYYQNNKLYDLHCNKAIVDKTIAQIITGDVFASLKKIDLDVWIKNMDKIYKKRFGTRMIGKDEAWKVWCEYFFEFLEWEFEDKTLNVNDEEGESKAIWANDVIKELEKFPKNKYVSCYIDLFSELLI